MDYTVQDIVQYAAQDNAVKAADAFDALMADRMQAAVDAKRTELAQAIFNGQQVSAEADEDTEEEEYEDSETTAEQD